MKPPPQHHWVNRRFMPWLLCTGCGLVRLRNARTDKAARKPCHPAD